jgi:hypothetical protein
LYRDAYVVESALAIVQHIAPAALLQETPVWGYSFSPFPNFCSTKENMIWEEMR